MPLLHLLPLPWPGLHRFNPARPNVPGPFLVPPAAVAVALVALVGVVRALLGAANVGDDGGGGGADHTGDGAGGT